MLDVPTKFKPPPEAPVFRPTREEFADPLQYIHKIKPLVEGVGICKIIPPAEWQPSFAIDVHNFRFTPRVQRLHELDATTRVKLNFLDRLAKYWELQGTPLRVPTIDRRPLDLHKLHKVVKAEGGFDAVTREKRWQTVAHQLDYPSSGHKSLASVIRNHYEKLLYPYDLLEAGVTVDPEMLKEDALPTKRKMPGSSGSGMRKTSTYGRYSAHSSRSRRSKRQIDNDACQLCDRPDNESQLLLCDGCDYAFHTYCLVPPLAEVPKGDWSCPRCVAMEFKKPLEIYGFDQAQKSYSLYEFGDMADKFKAEYFSMPGHLVPTDVVEQEFWRLISCLDEDVTVQYGADVHSLIHGSGFPTKKTKDVYPGDEEYISSAWNLNNLPLHEGSVLRFVSGDVSGMKVPWCYVGMCFSSFAWHIEDHWSYSINYLHWGEPKTWYGAPSSAAEELEKVMKERAPELFEQSPDLLHQLTTIINPNVLMESNIPIVRTNQCSGEFIVTFPRAYHAGFNQGYNFAEAVNFCPSDWLPFGRLCLENYKTVQRQCVFSHEELVCKMAADPSSLDLQLAAAAYKEMGVVVDQEKRFRKALHEKGVTEAEREAFELIPDDERQCRFCRTTCFLSALTCPCKPNEMVCIVHMDKLCSCPPAGMCLRYRYTLDELPNMLNRLRCRAEAYDIWSARVKMALTAQDDAKLSLNEMKSLINECKVQKYPDSTSLKTLGAAVREAEQYASIASQLLSRKTPRTRQLRNSAALGSDHRYGCGSRLSVNELKLFVCQIKKLPCRLKETETVDELLQKVVDFQKEAQSSLLTDVPLDADKLETLLEYGLNLDIDVVEIPKLKQALSQARWLSEVKAALEPHRDDDEDEEDEDCDNADGITLEAMRKLLEGGVTLAPHPAVEKAMATLQDLLTNSERWEEKAKLYLQGRPKHSVGALDAIIQESRLITAYLPNVNALKEVVRKAKDWCAKVESLQTADDPPHPHLEVLQALMQKGKSMPVSLDHFPVLENTVNNANTWKERTSRTFLKKNTSYTLLEVLSPRSDIGIYASGKKRKKRDGDVKGEVKVDSRGDVGDSDAKSEELRDSGAIVATFREAEHREIQAMRDLRSANIEKQQLEEASGEQQQKYCVCRKAPSGFMLQCELCKDWFHGTCVPLPKTSGMKTKPGQAALMQAAKELKFLCPLCQRSRRPRLETVLSLLVSHQKIPVTMLEGVALQCLTERAMAWQDRARQALATDELARALAKLSALSQRAVEQAAREKTEKIINAELMKAACNPELQGHLLLHGAFAAAGGSGGPSASSSSVSEADVPKDEGGASSDSVRLGGAEVSEHAYSSASKLAVSAPVVDSPRKHARKSPLVPRQLDSSPPGASPTVLELSDAARARLEELMMEGDLLEVSLDETQHIWKILQACSSSNMGSGSGRDNGSAPTDCKDAKSECAAGKKSGDSLEKRDKKRKIKRESSDNYEESGGSSAPREKVRKKSDGSLPGSTASAKAKDKGQTSGTKSNDISGSTLGSTGPSAGCGSKKEARKKEVKKKKRASESAKKDTSAANDSNDESAEEDCSATKCLKPIGDEVDWVQCDACQLWFHLLCIGLGKEEVAAVDNFMCIQCRRKLNSTDGRQSTAKAAADASKADSGQPESAGSQHYCAAMLHLPKASAAESCDLGTADAAQVSTKVRLETADTDAAVSVVSTPVPSMPPSPASADQQSSCVIATATRPSQAPQLSSDAHDVIVATAAPS